MRAEQVRAAGYAGWPKISAGRAEPDYITNKYFFWEEGQKPPIQKKSLSNNSRANRRYTIVFGPVVHIKFILIKRYSNFRVSFSISLMEELSWPEVLTLQLVFISA